MARHNKRVNRNPAQSRPIPAELTEPPPNSQGLAGKFGTLVIYTLALLVGAAAVFLMAPALLAEPDDLSSEAEFASLDRPDLHRSVSQHAPGNSGAPGIVPTPGIGLAPEADFDPTTINPNTLTLHSLLMMTDEQLEMIDPLVMNLVVIKGIPGYENIDITPYDRIVDDWASRIGRGLQLQEIALRQSGQRDPAWEEDPDLWRAGGMAVALAGPSIGIAYTSSKLDPAQPDQTFLPGVIDTKRGTCSNMPILYLAIAHRLHWPLKAVVSRDHMWCRWDDGVKSFNLEATSASSDGGSGSFLSTTDEEYIRQLRTPPLAIECGSDFTSLTHRKLLGVFLQTRAGYWAAQANWREAEHDLLLARSCFPENRDIFLFLHQAMSLRAGTMFGEDEITTQNRRYVFWSKNARRDLDLNLELKTASAKAAN